MKKLRRTKYYYYLVNCGGVGCLGCVQLVAAGPPCPGCVHLDAAGPPCPGFVHHDASGCLHSVRPSSPQPHLRMSCNEKGDK